MTIKGQLSLPANPPETYEELARLYVPRKIHDSVGQKNATTVIDWLSIRAHTKDQIEFLDLVSDLLDEYESQFLKEDNPIDPTQLLRHLVQENDISTRELGKILAIDHSVAARILKGERAITIEHAKSLSTRFKVDPKIFLQL
jgi:HTH-type transcriptional regulator / antitoxin HigA